jgi:hypothetical protein
MSTPKPRETSRNLCKTVSVNRTARSDRNQRNHFLKEGGELVSPLAGGHLLRSRHSSATPRRASLAGRCLLASHYVIYRALSLRIRTVQFRRMNDLAPIEPSTKPAKERKVSKRIRHCIDLLVTGRARTQVDAAAQAGITRERLCRALREDHVQTYLAQRTRVSLTQAQAPAAAALLRLLDQARSEFVQKDVAIHLLNLSGHKVDKDRGPLVSLNISPGWIIDLSAPGGDQTRFQQVGPGGGVIYEHEPASMINVTPSETEDKQ